MALKTAEFALMRLMRMERVMGVRMTVRRSRRSGGLETMSGGWGKQVYVVCSLFAVLSVRL
jgi:hypothetical protein